MDGENFPLIERKQVTSLVVALFFPASMVVLLFALTSQHGLRITEVLRDKAFAAICVLTMGLFVAHIFVLRANLLGSSLRLDDHSIALTRRGKIIWTVDFEKVETVTLRRLEIRTSYYHEALLIETFDGKKYTVPTSSVMFGRFPRLIDLILVFEGKGLVLRKA